MNILRCCVTKSSTLLTLNKYKKQLVREENVFASICLKMGKHVIRILPDIRLCKALNNINTKIRASTGDPEQHGSALCETSSPKCAKKF